MPDAQRGKGRTVAEIHQKWAQPRARAILPAGAIEPAEGTVFGGVLDKIGALQDDMRQRRIADALVSQTESEVDLQTAESELKRMDVEVKTLETKSRLQELKEKALANAGNGNSGSNDAILIALIEMLQNNQQAAVAQANSGQGSAIAEGLSSFGDSVSKSLTELRAELREVAGSQKPDIDPVEKLTAEMSTLIKLKEVFAALSPAQATVQSPSFSMAERDLATTIEIQKMQLDHEFKLAQLRQSEERWRADIAFKNREVEVEEHRAQFLGDGMKAFAEAARPVIQELAQMATQRAASPAPVPAYMMPTPMPAPAVPYPVTAPMVAAVNGNGHSAFEAPQFQPISMQCPDCGFEISLLNDKSKPTVMCPNCGEEKQIDWSD